MYLYLYRCLEIYFVKYSMYVCVYNKFNFYIFISNEYAHCVAAYLPTDSF